MVTVYRQNIVQLRDSGVEYPNVSGQTETLFNLL